MGDSTLRRRHALLVGIDEYPHFPAGTQLAGARADAECLGALLVDRLGFACGDVEVLTNDQATRDGIVAALGCLLERVDPGEVVWLHVSGHGSRRRAPGNRYRGDARQNVIVPYDSAHAGDMPNRDISGDELYAWLRHLSSKTARVTLVFDCCHAGTITREERDPFTGSGGRLRAVDEDDRSVGPLPFPWTALDRALPRPGESGWLPESQAYTLIAACRADQRAREITLRAGGGRQRTHGALSHALLEALGSMSPDASSESTYYDLHGVLTTTVRGRYPGQHPQVEGAADRLLLRLGARPARRRLMVLAHNGRRLVLDGGAIHDVTRGSVWSIMPSNASGSNASADDAGEGEAPSATARARVTLVAGVRSDAVLLADDGAPNVQVGYQAVEIEAGTDPAQLPVALEAPEEHRAWSAALAAAIDEAPALRRVHDPARADVIGAVLGPRQRAGRDARARALGAIATPIAVVVDRQDSVILPIRWQLDGLARADTVAALESLARFRRLRTLSNPHPNRLEGLVQMRLMRRDRDDFAWTRAEPQRPGAPPRFEDGESFALTLTNGGETPVYAHVISLGVGGGVGPIYPSGGACEALVPGHTVWVGDRPGQELWFEVPETLPFDQPGRSPWVGEENLLLVVTDDATDLRPLFQQSFREAAWQGVASTSLLTDLLAEILSHGFREAHSGSSPRTVAWHAELFAVTLRRRRSRPQCSG